MTKEVVCPGCRGYGFVSRFGENSVWSERCTNCGGTGIVKEPMTNADKIRAMNDDDLAFFCKELMFNDFKPACKKSTFFTAEHKPECEEDCVSCILDWCRQPAKEDT